MVLVMQYAGIYLHSAQGRAIEVEARRGGRKG